MYQFIFTYRHIYNTFIFTKEENFRKGVLFKLYLERAVYLQWTLKEIKSRCENKGLGQRK